MGLGRISAFVLLSVVSLAAWAQDPPPGFTDPTLLQTVLSGTIDTQIVINTDTEQQVYLRAFFNKVSPEGYLKVSTDFENYPNILPEVQEATTVKVNADRTVFDYSMDIVFQAGPFPFHVYPTGHQVITPASDPTKETTLHHEVTNYKDQFSLAQEDLRLIPYNGGILVEDGVHVKLVQASATATAIKSQLVQEFQRMMTAFRTASGGDPS